MRLERVDDLRGDTDARVLWRDGRVLHVSLTQRFDLSRTPPAVPTVIYRQPSSDGIS